MKKFDKKFDKKYNVFQWGRKSFHTDDEMEAWDYIMQSWSGYEVLDEFGYIREEFIPY